MRRFKNKYLPPKKLFDKARIIEEKELMKKYGLKNKREIWKVESFIKKQREIAKKLIIASEEQQKKFIAKLAEYGFLSYNATLDDALALDKRKVIERMLPVVVYKIGLANTVNQARQFVVHGHVFIKGKKVNVPSYLVKLDEEKYITLSDKVSKILKTKT